MNVAIWVPIWIIGAPFLFIIFSSMLFGPHSSMGQGRERGSDPLGSPGTSGSSAPGVMR